MGDNTNKQAETEALQTLIQALREYLSELGQNYNLLVQGAEACQMAMGNDDLSRIMLERLERAMEGLRTTAVEAQEVANSMVKDLQLMMEAERAVRNIY